MGRGQETDAEWAAIEAAADKQPRAPWLDNRSRVLPTWAGILESGLEHDDHRFRRAAYVRVGYGIGHEHQDSLDLQVVAHGLPMTIDGGQRRGYTIPTDSASFVHNTVLVDGAEAYRHSWVSALADHAGARYLAAEAVPPGGVQLLRRQVALVDVDEGQGSQPLSRRPASARCRTAPGRHHRQLVCLRRVPRRRRAAADVRLSRSAE